MAATDPRWRIWPSDWYLLASWVLAATVGGVVAVEPTASKGQVFAVLLAVVGATVGLGWLGARLTRRQPRSGPRPTTMGAVGTTVVTWLGWVVLFLLLSPFVLFGWEPVYTVQWFVWWMAGFQISRLLGRAVEIRSRQQSLSDVHPPAPRRPTPHESDTMTASWRVGMPSRLGRQEAHSDRTKSSSPMS